MSITEMELRHAGQQLRTTATGFTAAAERHDHRTTELDRAVTELPELWVSPAATHVTAAGDHLVGSLRPVPAAYRRAAAALTGTAATADRIADDVAAHAGTARAAATAAGDAQARMGRAQLRPDDRTHELAEADRKEALERQDLAQQGLEACAIAWTETCRQSTATLGAVAGPLRAAVGAITGPEVTAELGPRDPSAEPLPTPVDVVGAVESAIGTIGAAITAEWMGRSAVHGLRATAAGVLATRAGRPGPDAPVARAARIRLAAATQRRDAALAAGPASPARAVRHLAGRSPRLAAWTDRIGGVAARAPRLSGAVRIAGGATGHLGTEISFRNTVIAARDGDREKMVTNGLSTTGSVMMTGGLIKSAGVGAGAMLGTSVAFPPVAVVGAGLVVGVTMWQHRESIADGARAVGRGVRSATEAVGRGARATGEAIGRGARATGEAVERGARATGEAVERGTRTLVDGADRVGRRVGGVVGDTFEETRSFARRTLGLAPA